MFLNPLNEKDASHPFMAGALISVTTVGWADVPDCDRGDFGRRRAVDISRLTVQWIGSGRKYQDYVHAKGKHQNIL